MQNFCYKIKFIDYESVIFKNSDLQVFNTTKAYSNIIEEKEEIEIEDLVKHCICTLVKTI